MAVLYQGFHLFLEPLGLAIAVVFFYGFIGRLAGPAWLQHSVSGACFGVAAVYSMFNPLPLAEGVIIDIRSLFVGLSAAFFGPLAGIVTLAIGAMTRISIGGVGMASVCDVVIGVESVLMGLTETRLGLIPATIGPYVAARMGEANARRVFMSGRRFDSGEAQALGLLAKVVSADDLDTAVEAEVVPYLECAPEAVGRAKALLRALGPRIDADTIAHTVSELAACWQGDEAPEGIGAFFEKRKPKWQG